MTIDVVVITVIIAFFIRGYMKGIIIAAFSVLAIALGILASLKLSERLGTYLLEKEIVTSAWAPIVSYAILFIGVVLLVRLVAKAIESAMKAVMLGWVNKLIGGALYAFLGAIVLSALLWLGTETELIEQKHIADSKTYEYITPIAPWVADKVGYVIPMAKSVFADLEQFFQKVNLLLPEHVDTH